MASSEPKLTVFQRISLWYEDAHFWLLGHKCPFCSRWHSGWWHRNCPTLAALPVNEAVRRCSAKVREILADEPADKCVHGAHDACDKLDEAFPKTEG